MIQRLGALLGTGIVVFVMVGCSATKDVQMRSYLQDVQRVDQNRDIGNSGYIMGDPLKDTKEYKKTRKLYVWEFNKKNQINDTQIDVEEDYTSSDPQVKSRSAVSADPEPAPRQVRTETKTTVRRKIDLPDFDNEQYYKEAAAVVKEPVRYVDYTVEKNDTLQKISKKFYDSFSQWTKIYDVNRNRIDNPDVLRPGVTIQIPIYK